MTGSRTGWVVGSILAHGITAVPATLAYDRLVDGETSDAGGAG